MPRHKRTEAVRTRLWRLTGVAMVATLMAGGAAAWTLLPHETRFDTTTAVTRTRLVEASRSESRATLSSGSWDLGSDVDPDAKMTVREAGNKVVQALINGRDEAFVPAGFDPDHADGDTGNAYEFSQCTWWADTARRLGYWVDSTPRVGDVICFQRGQYGSDPFYGHVGIVESVASDGSITTSECGSAYNGKPFCRTFTAEQAAQLQFIHY